MTAAPSPETTWRQQRSALGAFNPIDLGAWMDLCAKASVPAVEARELARIPVDDVTCFDIEPAPASLEPFFRAVNEGMNALGTGWMVRWSCCSCADVKHRLGTGRHKWDPVFAKLFIDDFRAYDIVSEFPDYWIAAYARPWIEAKIIEGYPVEYRVYVGDNIIQGISNYYPQRALPDVPETFEDIHRCRLMTQALIAAQKLPLNCPQIERDYDVTRNHFSCDFIKTADGRMLFLEGGPGHFPHWGASKCAFRSKPEGVEIGARKPESAEAD